jgi:putative aminopeptidase FrvX
MGGLRLSRIGGIQWPTVETEGVWVFTPKAKRFAARCVDRTASGHIHSGADLPRDDKHLEVRLDAKTTSEKETRALGINIGDCVAFDTRTEVTNGFIRSRFLDDKACVANLVAAIKSMVESGQSPVRSVYFHISNYEEVGHGASAGIPDDVAELVTVDMAVVGTWSGVG